ncbi:NACHT and WD repeat domain-containing protein 2-like [Dermacentor andersoni]|uniref:NACHT and WD repeat domain-containing protein 2-like n=1 Tax=Dermacentor andersoni TaxID=34620 RepID=UPI003B3B1212
MRLSRELITPHCSLKAPHSSSAESYGQAVRFQIFGFSNFEQERRVVQENVLPELQRHCASLGVDVELLDLQQGQDPRLRPADATLRELEDCHARSLGCFLLCLLGNKYRPFALPDLIERTVFEPLHQAAQDADLDVSLLGQWYLLNENLVPPAYELQPPSDR